MAKLIYSRRFQRRAKKLPRDKRTRLRKVLKQLEKDPGHQSLRTGKLSDGSWYVRIDGGYRLIFDWIGDELHLLTVGPHDILK